MEEIIKKLVTKCDCALHVKTMTEEIKDVKDAVNDLRVDVSALPEKILDKASSRFASKITENIVYGLVAIILTAVIGNIIVASNKSHSNEEVINIIEKAIGSRVTDLETKFNQTYELAE